MAYWVLKVILSPVLFVLYRVSVEGRGNLPKKGGVVLAANHQSFCDSFFLPLVLTRRVTFLAKAEYFDQARTAWFFRAAGQIPVRRDGGDASDAALRTAVDVISAGRALALYPEGTRSPDASVHRGKTGAARLAAETGCPVVPVGIVGTSGVQPIGCRVMRPFRRVGVRFGAPMHLVAPIDPETGRPVVDNECLRVFTDRLMHEIARLSERPYVDQYVPRPAPGPGSRGPRVTGPVPRS
ncbi:MAG TPA: lysophospholipid acyltransferase family protein [Acidimicrobiales bacterium]|nr:lysophospholipid acyltransferase family protein [Acidimicrobiales bacterium]